MRIMAEHGRWRIWAKKVPIPTSVIPASKAEDYVIVCGVFIHWDAADDTKIYQYNYEATKLSIQRAMKGEPKIEEVLSKKDTAKHPFSPK